jgi:hypothetical protein
MSNKGCRIKEFDDASSGVYVCTVKVNQDSVKGYVEAQIYGRRTQSRGSFSRCSVPDTIIQVLLEVSSENIALGERVWFDCKVTGDPDAAIVWSKDGSDSLPDNAQVGLFFT